VLLLGEGAALKQEIRRSLHHVLPSVWCEARLGAVCGRDVSVLARKVCVWCASRAPPPHPCRAGALMSAKLDADLLTAQEIEALLRVCSLRAPTGVRNRALIALAWRTGLRLGEILALKPKDIDLGSGTLVVQRGKGGKRRVVGLDAGTAALVQRWLDLRRPVPSGLRGRSPWRRVGRAPTQAAALRGAQLPDRVIPRGAEGVSLVPFSTVRRRPAPVRPARGRTYRRPDERFPAMPGWSRHYAASCLLHSRSFG
jgi:integrase